MFAGAAREAVFSRPEVIRRVNADFVPVALKAHLVNNPPADDEGRLYREIGRSKPAPQGICVVNSAGKVLDWALMFDDDKSVLAFLDHCRERFARFPDAKQPVAAERYMKFPSTKLEDVADNGKAPLVIERHAEGKSCPATPRLRQGTIVAKVFGRALEKDGKPVADTVRQEHYVEDRFQLSVDSQERLAQALAAAGAERFPIPDQLARLFVSHAYLGQLDVNPLSGGRPNQCEFWGRKVAPGRIHIEGKSEVAGASRPGQGGDGRLWEHDVKLTWDGLIDLKEGRVSRVLLVARGTEKLKWANKHQELKGQKDVAHLPAGHAIDLSCGARYGIIGEPVAADQAAPDGKGGDEPGEQVPTEARRQLLEALGPTFLVFHPKTQEELKLSKRQKEELEQRLQVSFHYAMQFFQKLGEREPSEREKELHAYRRKAEQGLAAFMKDVLKPEQHARLRQLMLQREGLFALGNPDVAKELQLTDEQKRQFASIVQEMEGKLQPLLKEAHSGGDPEKIRPTALQLRKDHERKLEALLSDTQKKQWRKLLGKPFDVGD